MNVKKAICEFFEITDQSESTSACSRKKFARIFFREEQNNANAVI